MDLFNELDYEEDGKDLEKLQENLGAEEISDSLNLSGCEDQYLQIDLSEEEKNFSQNASDAFADFNGVNIQNIGKVNEKSRNSNQQNVFLEEQNSINSSENNDKSRKKLKEKRSSRNFQHQPLFRKNKAKAHGVRSRICEGRGRFKQTAVYYKNKKTFGSDLNSVEIENCETKNEARSDKAHYDFLQDDEKEILKLKKQARLKRFMHNGSFSMSKKLDDSNSEKDIWSITHLPVGQCSKKEKLSNIEGQKKQNSDTYIDQGILPEEKPLINKELLLKKRNPFDAGTRVSEPKPENENKAEQEDVIDSKLFDSTIVHELLMKKEGTNILSLLDSSLQDAPAVKSDVKFVRTVSKSFIELTQKTGHPSPLGESFGKGGFLRQGCAQVVESQLTGRIVKVLNISPSTTAEDILALCSTVGMVMEVKLNIPKENSVVIRFAEPTCAEKFYTFYHGREVNNCILSVMIV